MKGENERVAFPMGIRGGNIKEESTLGREGIFDIPSDRFNSYKRGGQNYL